MKMAAWLSQCMGIKEGGGNMQRFLRSEQSHIISHSLSHGLILRLNVRARPSTSMAARCQGCHLHICNN